MKKQLNTSATNILRQDHRVIKKLFDKYDETNSPAKKEEIIQTISLQMNLHMTLEEGLFYPAISKSFKDQKLLDKGKEWHHRINLLLDKLARVYADEDREEYNTLVAKLKDCFANYIKTEEDGILSKIEKTQLDLIGLGKRLSAHKAELTKSPVDLATEKDHGRTLAMAGPRNRIQPEPNPTSNHK